MKRYWIPSCFNSKSHISFKTHHSRWLVHVLNATQNKGSSQLQRDNYQSRRKVDWDVAAVHIGIVFFFFLEGGGFHRNDRSSITYLIGFFIKKSRAKKFVFMCPSFLKTSVIKIPGAFWNQKTETSSGIPFLFQIFDSFLLGWRGAMVDKCPNGFMRFSVWTKI